MNIDSNRSNSQQVEYSLIKLKLKTARFIQNKRSTITGKSNRNHEHNSPVLSHMKEWVNKACDSRYEEKSDEQLKKKEKEIKCCKLNDPGR